MSTAYGPTVGRRKLRTAIRRAREAAGLTQEQVALAMDWSLSKLIRIESGYVSISTNDVKALLSHYHVRDPDEVSELVRLARISRQRTWWSQYRDSLPAAYYSYIGLEAEASSLSFYQSVGMPGLLQTEAYARAIISGEATQPTPEAVEQRVAARIERQKLIHDGNLRMVAVLDEAVLHRQIGGPDVMRAQLAALLTASKLWNVSIQVIPFREGAYASMLSSFHILTFAESSSVVYIEGLTGDLYAEGEDVRRCTVVFNSLRASALSATASAAMIKKIRDTEHQELGGAPWMPNGA